MRYLILIPIIWLVGFILTCWMMYFVDGQASGFNRMKTYNYYILLNKDEKFRLENFDGCMDGDPDFMDDIAESAVEEHYLDTAEPPEPITWVCLVDRELAEVGEAFETIPKVIYEVYAEHDVSYYGYEVK